MERNIIVKDDCIGYLSKQPEGWIDLVFADPPFNIGYKYDVYEDTRAYDEYYDWTHQWMAACDRALKPTGSFWVAIGDEYAAEVRMIGRKLGLTLRNWVIWHYTFGQATKAKFSRSHTHLFYFTKSPTEFTFNAPAVSVLSDRQKEYGDKRANPRGRTPFDVWTEFPRVCGTFSERKGWHPCQMPEMLLGRIVRACSNPGDLVFDPFAGSGTTLVVARKLSRDYLGTEISPGYVENIRQRLDETKTPACLSGEEKGRWPKHHKQELASLYVENGVPSDKMRNMPNVWHSFVQQFNGRMANLGVDQEYTGEQIWKQMERLRKSGKLGRIRVHAKTTTKGHYDPPLIKLENSE